MNPPFVILRSAQNYKKKEFANRMLGVSARV